MNDMNDDFFPKGIKEIRHLRKKKKKKRAVLSRLLEHAETHPAEIISPWKVYISGFRFQYAIAGALIVLLAGGGAASAAEGALPGDILYPVKIYVNEPLRGAMVLGGVPKARFEAERTIRRLEEAETLAAQGRLDKTSAETVREHFENSVTAFNSAVDNLESNGSMEDAVNARVDFEAHINAHSRILSTVRNSEVPQKDDIVPLHDSVEENANKAKERRTNTVETFLKDSRNEFDERAQSVRTIIKETEDRLKGAESTSGTSGSSVRDVILENIPQTLQTAEDALEDARQKRGSGDSDNAYSALLDSESAAKEADISLTRGLKFGEEEKEKEKRDSSRKENNSGKGSGSDRDGKDNSGSGSNSGKNGD
ncbi:hypothetical protein HYT04_02495 [Candidatus Kaiserbacteria bacterium]|nr:hypothetical protein [Candidatus Kaiserbacteria bacterium]